MSHTSYYRQFGRVAKFERAYEMGYRGPRLSQPYTWLHPWRVQWMLFPS